MRQILRSVIFATAVVTIAVVAAGLAAIAATGRVVVVDLADTTSTPPRGSMAVIASTLRVKAGDVTFRVANRSSTLVHEMLVVPLAGTPQPLPYDAASDRLDEARLTSVGEIPELDPGKGGQLRVRLAPGLYALLCNQPGHYNAGMTATLNVTP